MEKYLLRTQSQPHQKIHIQSTFPSLSAGMSEHPNVRTHDIICLFPTQTACYTVTENNRLVWYDLFVTNPCWLLLISLLSSKHLQNVYMIICYGIFPLGFQKENRQVISSKDSLSRKTNDEEVSTIYLSGLCLYATKTLIDQSAIE